MGLIARLLEQDGDAAGAACWGERADILLEAETRECLYETMEDYGLIRNAVVDLPHGSGINESAMYGDYYYMEGLYRRLNQRDGRKTSLLY